MSKSITFGIIGSGMIAQDHLTNLNEFEEARVKWISAVIKDKVQLEATAKKFKVPNITTDYLDVLKDKEVDVVVICTPPFTHFGILLESLNYKKHILIEKPMVINEKELNTLLNEAEKHPELTIMDCSCRHARLQPKFRFVRDLISSGKLGDIYHIHHNACYRQGRPGIEYHPTAKWFLDRNKSGGGPIIDWGVYDLSFHLGILNDRPELMSCEGFVTSGLDSVDPGTPVNTVEEHGSIWMRFSGGLTYYWERAAHANVEVPDETRIYGTRGGLKFSFLTWESPGITLYELDENNNPVSNTITVAMDEHKDDGYELTRHFLSVLKGKEESMMPLHRAAKHLRIIFEAYRKTMS